MEVPTEAIVGLVLALLGGGGTAAVVRKRFGANHGPESKRSASPPECSPDVAKQVEEMHARHDAQANQVAEMHRIVARRDDQDASILMRTLSETATHTKAMAQTLTRIETALSQRPRLPSSPDPAE
jgi:hypothetical protein